MRAKRKSDEEIKGKKLKLSDENTRIVLFEKHHIYYYKANDNQKCLGICMSSHNENKRIYIGSYVCCHLCVYNMGFDILERVIYCKNLTEALNNKVLSINQNKKQ
jgi:hypothetical protein